MNVSLVFAAMPKKTTNDWRRAWFVHIKSCLHAVLMFTRSMHGYHVVTGSFAV